MRTPRKASTAPPSAHATYIGGAPGRLVTASVRMRSSVAAGSKRSASTAVAPVAATMPSTALSP